MGLEHGLWGEGKWGQARGICVHSHDAEERRKQKSIRTDIKLT